MKEGSKGIWGEMQYHNLSLREQYEKQVRRTLQAYRISITLLSISSQSIYHSMSKDNISPLAEEIVAPESQKSNCEKIALPSLVLHSSAPIKENADPDNYADLSTRQLTKLLKELDGKVLDDFAGCRTIRSIRVNRAIEELKEENADLKKQNGIIVAAFNSLQEKLKKILRFKDNELRPLLIEPSVKQGQQTQKAKQQDHQPALRQI